MNATKLTPDEQHGEVSDAIVQLLQARCGNSKCREGTGSFAHPTVTESFDNEAMNVFVDRLLDEGWQVYGKRKTLLCPACATAKGLGPVALSPAV